MTHLRDETPETGFHFRLDLEESAVEVDLFRLDPDGGVFLEVFGRRGSDNAADSVVVTLTTESIPKLTGALMDVYRRGRDQAARVKAAAEAKKKDTK